MIPTFDLGNVVRRLIATTTRLWANPVTRFTSIGVLVAGLVATFNSEIASFFGAPDWLLYPSFLIDVSTRSDLFQTLGYCLNFSMLASVLDTFFSFGFKVISFLAAFLSTLIGVKVIQVSYKFLRFFLSSIG